MLHHRRNERNAHESAWPLCCLAIVATAVCLFFTAGTVVAEESTRKSMAMREKVYEKLSRAQEAVEAEDWEKAFEKLRDVEKMKDLEPHEKAQLYTAYGYTYFTQERYRDSADAYEKVLLQESVPEALLSSTRYTLAQLWFQMVDLRFKVHVFNGLCQERTYFSFTGCMRIQARVYGINPDKLL